MRIYSVICFVVLLICFANNNADACICLKKPSPCARFSEYSVVFVGKVTSIEKCRKTVQPKSIGPGCLVAHFNIERIYKGLPENTETIDVGTGYTDCSFDFETGRRYIVYAVFNSLDEEGRKLLNISLDFDLYTDGCYKTQSLPEGQNDVDLIEALINGRPETRIFGKVDLIEMRLARWPKDIKLKGGAAGIKIEARNEKHTFDTITDETGNFQFRNIPEGTYKVKPFLPSTHSGMMGHDPTWEEVEIRLPERCGYDYYYAIQLNGVIRGRVLDTDGNPAGPDFEVSIILADSPPGESSPLVGRSERTNDDGTYEFNGLLPGRYIIGTELLRPPDRRSAYGGIYHPSSFQPGKAQIIHLGEGEKVNDIDIQLLLPMP